MAQEMSVEELRRLAGMHKGLTPESWLMDWAAGEIDRLRADLTACRGSVKTDLNGYERLVMRKREAGSLNDCDEQEAQRLFDLLGRIDEIENPTA